MVLSGSASVMGAVAGADGAGGAGGATGGDAAAGGAVFRSTNF
eukprot:CAMPEP_0185746638 /NCGR_PEP_ID=MMETSP1174-20130828/5258_1 /TAXON_ID=35687 /ORGANISM="Dictyocha speculum, Strain CCMP1381" /LENGTH=42 /DNA_ID= /DNA_START= /DNA_END= /DNA_ORIENTATION=